MAFFLDANAHIGINSKALEAYVSFNNPSWTSASFTCRGALIYNASKANRSIAVLNFGADRTVTNGTFTVTFPANTVTDAIIRST